MKRLMLASTAAIVFAAPVLAQTGPEAAVSDALLARGYSVDAIEMLTDAQVAELYLALTSEDTSAVQAVIAGFDLEGDIAASGLRDTARDDNVVVMVEAALTRSGYPAGTVDALSDAQIAELYLAMTSEDGSDIGQVIDGFGLEATAGVPNAVSDADMFVMDALARRGVSEADIAGLSSADLTELYIALTSDDEASIQQAIRSALES